MFAGENLRSRLRGLEDQQCLEEVVVIGGPRQGPTYRNHVAGALGSDLSHTTESVMKIECTNAAEFDGRLTQGKKYEVVEAGWNSVKIIDDTGAVASYGSSKFEFPRFIKLMDMDRAEEAEQVLC